MTMLGTAYRWPLEAIWEEVSSDLTGFSVEVLPEIDSTNSELMRRARAGQCDPVLLVAEHQTAGRGRLGRQWLGALVSSENGDAEAMPSLMFSLGMPLQCVDWSGLSLAVGMSVAKSVKALCSPEKAADIGLKWPNDVWWQGCKLAGILIETAGVTTLNAAGGARYAIIGIGVNIVAPDILASVPPGQLVPAMPVGMRTIAPGIGAAQTLKQLALPLVQAVLAFEKQGFEPLMGAFAGLDLLDGKAVQLSDGRSGIARSVDGTGALQVDIKGERHSISSGEVSVRPLHNTVLTMNGHG
jgi:BirA family biotin operon repressor/biotin-[acetyl-CoA-carboxylase] ligase